MVRFSNGTTAHVTQAQFVFILDQGSESSSSCFTFKISFILSVVVPQAMSSLAIAGPSAIPGGTPGNLGVSVGPSAIPGLDEPRGALIASGDRPNATVFDAMKTDLQSSGMDMERLLQQQKGGGANAPFPGLGKALRDLEASAETKIGLKAGTVCVWCFEIPTDEVPFKDGGYGQHLPFVYHIVLQSDPQPIFILYGSHRRNELQCSRLQF